MPGDRLRPSPDALAATIRRIEPELAAGYYERRAEELHSAARFHDAATFTLLASRNSLRIADTAWEAAHASRAFGSVFAVIAATVAEEG